MIRREDRDPPFRVGAMFACLAAANILAWIWAFAAFADRPVLLGSALLAWVFGLRHAVDVDHIAAIDNVVRKLTRAGRHAHATGLYFSLGHSTVVALACVAIAVSAAAWDLDPWKAALGGIGSAVSAVFLLLAAAMNLAALRGTWRAFRLARLGEDGAARYTVGHGAAPDGAGLGGSGPLARLMRKLPRFVSRPGHMYPLGFLFGLGFDTATEIGLLALAAAQAVHGMPPWQVMIFPALFTAAMALVDTADSVFMVGVFGWASNDPVRKLWYNLTVTATSVAVAVLVGGIEALGLLADRLNLDGGVWSLALRLNNEQTAFGCAVIGVFAVSWAISALLYRWRSRDPALTGTE